MSRGTTRGDKKRLARASDDLRKGLARRDAELIATAIAELGPEAPAEDLARASRAVLDVLRALHRSREWGRLRSIGVAIEAIECGGGRLIDASPEEDRPSAWWSLLWGSALSGDFRLARAMWVPLEAETGRRHPDLASAMAAWLEGSGAPTGDILTRFETAAAAVVDPRLGAEDTATIRASVDPPRTADAVGPALALAFVTLPLRDLRTTVDGWLAVCGADGTLRVAIAEAACELALLETLRLRPEERGGAIAFLTRSMRTLAEAAVLPADHVLCALRLGLADLGAGSQEMVRAAAELIRLAASDARTRDLVVDALVAMELPSAALLPLIDAASDVAPGARLFWAYASLVAKTAERRSDTSGPEADQEWLRMVERSLRRLLDRGVSAEEGRLLALALQALDVPDRNRVLATLVVLVADAALLVKLCLAMWDALEVPLRKTIATRMAERFGCATAGYCDDCEEWHSSRPFLLAPSDRELWARLGSRLAGYDFDLLAWWSEDQRSDAVDSALLTFLDDHRGIARYVDALELAARRAPRSRAAVVSRMIACFSADADALAFAVIAARLERGARERVEQAFLAAVDARPGVRTPAVVRALRRIERAEQTRARRRRKRAGGSLRLPVIEQEPGQTPAAGATK